MTIGQNIKRFRKNADMTQEELAEMLSISSQAVSRWETDSAMPDISLLPALVSIFGVTSDELLGIDTIHVQEKAETYKKAISDLYKTHKYQEMLELSRQAYREMPSNMELIGQLAFALTSGDNAAKAENIDEAILLYKLILEKSVDNILRFRATSALCRLYAEKKHDKEQARFYANQLPKGHIQTASYLIGQFDLLEDSEKESFYRGWIEQYTTALTDTIYSLADPDCKNLPCKLDTSEKIILLTQILEILKIIYGNNLLSQNREFYEINRIIGCLWLLENEEDKALDHFELAFEYAKAFDTYHDGTCYTSAALRGVVCDEHNLWDTTALQDMLERLTTQSGYDGLRENPRFMNLVNCLKSGKI